MIRNQSGELSARKRLKTERKRVIQESEAMRERGEPPLRVEAWVWREEGKIEDLKDDLQEYWDAKRRRFDPVRRLEHLGRLLIRLRIARGYSQKTLAKRTGVSPAQVSRDERTEYAGASLERAQKVLDALVEEIEIRVVTGVPRVGKRRG